MFDIIGTCFSLEGPRREVVRCGAPALAFDLWFAQSLRDAFALSHSGGYRPLREMLRADLPRSLREAAVDPSAAQIDAVMRAFAEMDAHPELKPALSRLAGAGWRLVALTQGGLEATESLLLQGGVRDLFSDVLSSDAVSRTKPHPEVYRLALDRIEGEAWMVAAHAWDIAGAARAGMRTAFVTTDERSYPDAVFPVPDIMAPGLLAVAERLLERTAGSG